jgi:hypothetical protein
MAEENQGPKSLHLVELRASNFMGLKAVTVSLNTATRVVEVSGPNGAGKTSFMRAIESLVGGKAVHPSEAIRRGEDQAEVIGRLKGSAGELVVERRWKKTEKGETSTVVVRGADGARYDKPQTVLDALFNATLDPEAFMRMEKPKQLELLKELSGLNFGALEGKRADLYEKRTDVNRRGGDLRARFEAMAKPPVDLPAEPVDVNALLAEQEEAQKVRLGNAAERSKLGAMQGRVDAWTRNVSVATSRVAELEQELAEQRAKTEKYAATLAEAMEAFSAQEARVAELKDPDTSRLSAQIAAAQATNIAIEREKDRQKVDWQLAELRKQKELLTAEIEAIDKEKTDKIAAAKFPVEGLGLGVDGPTFNGLPFEQVNHAQQLRASTAIMLAKNPTIRVLGIRNGSALDSKGMTVVAEEAVKRDAQIFVERVADKGEVGIVFEDGEVVPLRAVKNGGGQGDLPITLEGRQS